MNKFKSLSLSIVAGTMLFTGCATTELQTNAKMTQSIFINPVKKELRTVFLSSKNTSGQKINLENTIIAELQAKGYQVIDDPEAATYVLMVNVLYCDKKQENNAGGGALGAGAIGAGVAGYNGGLIAKATEDTIYQMQVDIVIREKAKGPVYSTNSTAAGQASVSDSKKSGFLNSFGGAVKDSNATGHLNSNMANANTQSYESDFIEHKTMMLAEATKMRLTLAEATPILEKQISNQIAGLF